MPTRENLGRKLILVFAVVSGLAWVLYPFAEPKAKEVIAIVFGALPVGIIGAVVLYQLECYTSGYRARLFEVAHHDDEPLH